MNEMNILCATDKNFLNPAYVTIYSVIKNHRDIKINFYILVADDVSKIDQDQLKDFIEKQGSSVFYMYVDDSCYNKFIQHERFTKTAYFRLMAHELLPQSLERILYLDVDIIVNSNIYEDFYSKSFEGKYLIATSHNPEPAYYNMLNSKLVNYESAAKGEFFNSGVLLMNLELFRKNVTLETYIKAYNECTKNNIEVFYDQGLLNYMFYDKTRYLSSMDYNYRYSIPKDYAKRLSNRPYKKAIIHYTGMKQPYKPWDLLLTDEEIAKFGEIPYEMPYFYVSKELNELMKIWWKYAESTPVYPQILHDMEIKHKWFKRNLLDFMIEHNKLVKKNKSKSRILKYFIK